MGLFKVGAILGRKLMRMETDFFPPPGRLEAWNTIKIDLKKRKLRLLLAHVRVGGLFEPIAIFRSEYEMVAHADMVYMTLGF